jgi:PmbA protein
MNAKTLEFAKRCVDLAVKKGAKEAEAFCQWGRDFSVTARDQEVENLSQSTSSGVGLRAIRDGRLGFGFTSDLRIDQAASFVDRVVALSGETAADENNTLPSGTFMKSRNPSPAIYDEKTANLSADWKINAAIEMEKVALSIDPRIKVIEQVGVGDYLAEVAIVNNHGLVDEYKATYLYAFCVPFAKDESGGQSDYWQDIQIFFDDLMSPEAIARKSVKRTLRMLGAQKIDTANMPVVFDPNMARGFIGGLIGAVNGDMVYKNASFLADKLGTDVAAPEITVVDDGLMDRRMGSSPFDGEGAPTRKNVILDGGVLKSFLYDTYTANKAKTTTTANASRGYSSLPRIGTNNFYLVAGDKSPESIVGDIKKGLYVTKMMGRGANTVNGDYSRGASGMLIENGELTIPVQEVTVAGNMLDMLKKIDAVGSDLIFMGSNGAPTIRFSEISVSGK